MIHKVKHIQQAWSGREETLSHVKKEINNCTNALYIGAKCPRGGALLPELLQHCKVTIVEAWEDNANKLKQKFNCKVVHSTIQEFIKTCEQFDIIIWWHGPAHVEVEKLPSILESLIEKANKLVILGSPYGEYEQGAIDSNPFEVHLSALHPHFYAACGFNTFSALFKDNKKGKGTHITAWHFKNTPIPIDFYSRVFDNYKYLGKNGTDRDFIYKWAIAQIPKTADKILDIGCGPGRLIELAYDKKIDVVGIDVVPKAVTLAKKATPSANIILGTIEHDINVKEFNYFIMTEFLEHYEKDKQLLKSLPKGSTVIATVPTFNDYSHVRFFPKLSYVDTRYKELFNDYSSCLLPNSTRIFGFCGRIP